MRDRLIELIREQAREYDGKGIWRERLADNLLENGVFVPPCKIGNTVWSIDNAPRYKPILECEVAEIGKDRHYPYIVVEPKSLRGLRRAYTFHQIGKTVFLTKEEAEQALKGGAE